MWTQLLVIVGYYGLAAPTLCLAFREEPSLVVTFQLFSFLSGKPGIFKRFGLSGCCAEIDPKTVAQKSSARNVIRSERLGGKVAVSSFFLQSDFHFGPLMIINSFACDPLNL